MPRKLPQPAKKRDSATGFSAWEMIPESIPVMTVNWILRAADGCRDRETYWYMYAAQAHALPLIPGMTQEDCRVLLDWYDGAYPPRDRMPVQEQVYKALKKAARKTWW